MKVGAGEKEIRVLAVCAFPKEFPCTRYRLLQYVEPLARHGIRVDVRTFFDSGSYARYQANMGSLSRLRNLAGPLVGRIADIFRARKYDLIFVQREALFFGPAVFEWFYRTAARAPMILDLDDAVYIPYSSPTYGKIGTFLKFFGKTDRLIRSASLVVCGGRFLADHVESIGGRSAVVPTVVDPEVFLPAETSNDPPVIGWIGTPSTYPFLESIFPALRDLAKRRRFKLRLRGTGRERTEIEGVDVEDLPWRLETEIADFRSFDIGLYPLSAEGEVSLDWVQGKSGFKAIQYLTLGIPYVVSPLGVAGEIGVPGETHFEARSLDDWEAHLEKLLDDVELRHRMGAAGRRHALENYDLDTWAAKLAELIRDAADRSRAT